MMLQNEKVLVTGPAGQVGFPVARELAKNNEVYGMARFSKPADRQRLESVGVKCLKADMLRDPFTHVPDDFTYVLNFAVLRTGDFDEDLAANAEGLGRLMYHCRRAKAWLACSSIAVYHDAGPHHPIKETDPLGDTRRAYTESYSLAKIAAEAMARFAARQWNIPTTIARLAMPYGDNGGLPAYLFDAMLAGQPVPVHPNKPNVYNLLHEDDLVEQIPGLIAAAAVPATIVNWGGSELVSIEEMCAYMSDLTGVELKFNYTDKTDGPLILDLKRMLALVEPTKVHWRDGIRRMIQARHPNVRIKGA